MRGSSRDLVGAGASSTGTVPGVGRRWKGKGRAAATDEAGASPKKVPEPNGIVINVVDASPDEPGSQVELSPTESSHTDDLESEESYSQPRGGSPYLSADAAASSSSLRSLGGDQSNSEGRGQTQYSSLEDHTASWEQDVDVVVQMGIARDTHDLLPNELKIVVQQYSAPGGTDVPRNPHFGAVYLNLAEYANKGPITRKHLLRESKTNALLKLTIELQHVGGEKRYVAPPLRKEVMAGITGLLTSERLRSTPLPFADPAPVLSSNRSGSSSSLSGSGSTPSIHVPSVSSSTNTAPFASSRLTDSGPGTTRDLIEALFNPAPSADDAQTPFTYFDPDAAPADDASLADSASLSEARSIDTSGSAAPSDALAQNSASMDSKKHWWRARPRRRQTEYPAPEVHDPSPPPPPPQPKLTNAFIRVASPLPIRGGTTLKMAGGGPPHPRPTLLSAKTGSEGFVTITASTA